MKNKMQALAALLAVAPSVSSAAINLGDIQVISQAHEPFRAVIDVHPQTDRHVLQTLQVKLAPATLFERTGLKRSAFLDSLRFSPDVKDGKNIIRVASALPLSTPFVNFLLDVADDTTQTVKYFSFRQAAVDAVQANTRPVQTGSAYRVRSGDSLSTIARHVASEQAIPFKQTMLALFRKNPHAFVNQDMNKLKAGVNLTLPGKAEVHAIASADASAFFLESRSLLVTTDSKATGKADNLDPLRAKEDEYVVLDTQKQFADMELHVLKLSKLLGEAQGTNQQLEASIRNKSQIIATLDNSLDNLRHQLLELSESPAEVSDTTNGDSESATNAAATAASQATRPPLHYATFDGGSFQWSLLLALGSGGLFLWLLNYFRRAGWRPSVANGAPLPVSFAQPTGAYFKAGDVSSEMFQVSESDVMPYELAASPEHEQHEPLHPSHNAVPDKQYADLQSQISTLQKTLDTLQQHKTDLQQQLDSLFPDKGLRLVAV